MWTDDDNDPCWKNVFYNIDYYSRHTTTYLMKQMIEISDKIKGFVAVSSKKFQFKLTMVENTGAKAHKHILHRKELNIKQQFSNTPEQNGIAERKNQSLVEMGTSMLMDANLPDTFWGKAKLTSTYLQNWLPSKAIETNLYEMWHGIKSAMNHIGMFSCKTYVYITREKNCLKRGKRETEDVLEASLSASMRTLSQTSPNQ